jgi:hypothetical protein
MKCKWSPVSTVLSVFILIALAVLFSRKSFALGDIPVTLCNKPDVAKGSIKLGEPCCAKKAWQCARAPGDIATCANMETDFSKPDRNICI